MLRIAAVALSVLLLVTLFGGWYLFDLTKGLPELSSAPEVLEAEKTSFVYAADGTVLAEWHGDQDRRVVSISSITRQTRDAVIAIEDPRFYEHEGVDAEAILASFGSSERAGSTITQQLVRVLFAGQRRGITQKIREALMAYEIEARTPKDKVLEAYLNMVYLGNGYYGVESAAKGYFGKTASQLSLSEAAMLAGMIDAPGRFSPQTDLAASESRRLDVLAKMRDLALITSDEEVEARSRKPVLVPPEAPEVAPYFVEYVKKDLIDRYGTEKVFTGGLRVRTTLDLGLQKRAEAAADKILPSRKDPEVAIVTVDPHTGQVLAMVGGRDFKRDKYNLAAQGRRQPGSAFKPFVLVAALEKGISPSRRFPTSPITIKVKDGDWRVTNYENEFATGSMTLRAATNWSVNAVYARLVMLVGPEKVVDAARRMGITSPLEANPAIALGGLSRGVSPLEMASAYGTLATRGIRVEPFAVAAVQNDRGQPLYEHEARSKRVLDKRVADTASAMLHEVVLRGTGVNSRIKRWSAGKTGTSQSYRDAWFVGYTPDLSTAVWVGYRDSARDMLHVHGQKVAGGSFPAMIWGRYMSGAVAPAPAVGPDSGETTPGASAMVKVTLCRETLLLANPRCPEPLTLEMERGLAPRKTCTKH